MRPVTEGMGRGGEMDWRRGGLRLWLLVSALWIGWRAYLTVVEALNWTATRERLGMKPAPLFSDMNALDALAVALLPPIAVLALGWAAAWAARGFRRVDR